MQNTSTALIDWLSYTLPEDTNIAQMWQEGRNVDWKLQEGKGRHGYEKKYCWKGGELWTGHKNSGPHVDLSGAACRDLEAAVVASGGGGKVWDWEKHLAWLISLGAKFSRLDFAVDVVGGGLVVEALVGAIEGGRCKSRWKPRTWRVMKGIAPGERHGITLYMGSPSSSSMLRAYNKKVEQGLPEEAPEWTRVEFQARHEVAVELAARISLEGLAGGLSVLRSYVDFLESTGHTMEAWRDAMQSVVASPLKVPRRGNSLEKMEGWIATSAAPAIAVLLEAGGGDVDAIRKIAAEGRGRWNAKHKSMVDELRQREH